MERYVAALLLSTALTAAACAGRTHQLEDSDPITFMQVFEMIQMTPGEDVMLVGNVEGEEITVYRLATEPMDRLVYLWGEDGPAAPVFFSMKAAATFSALQGIAMKTLKVSAEDAEKWAWTKLHEPLKPEEER